MPIPHSRLTTAVAVAVIAASAAMPTSALALTDLRSPDARDAAAAATGRHAATSTSRLAATTSQDNPPRDLRSPDARDAALRAVRPPAATHDGFAWDAALLGGAGTLGATLLAGAGLLTVRHRRRPLGVS